MVREVLDRLGKNIKILYSDGQRKELLELYLIFNFFIQEIIFFYKFNSFSNLSYFFSIWGGENLDGKKEIFFRLLIDFLNKDESQSNSLNSSIKDMLYFYWNLDQGILPRGFKTIDSSSNSPDLFFEYSFTLYRKSGFYPLKSSLNKADIIEFLQELEKETEIINFFIEEDKYSLLFDSYINFLYFTCQYLDYSILFSIIFGKEISFWMKSSLIIMIVSYYTESEIYDLMINQEGIDIPKEFLSKYMKIYFSYNYRDLSFFHRIKNSISYKNKVFQLIKIYVPNYHIFNVTVDLDFMKKSIIISREIMILIKYFFSISSSNRNILSIFYSSGSVKYGDPIDSIFEIILKISSSFSEEEMSNLNTFFSQEIVEFIKKRRDISA